MSATITKGYTFGSTELVTSTKLHSLVDSATISGITSSEISSVNGAAFTSLSSIPSSAGQIPMPRLNLDDIITLTGSQITLNNELVYLN